MRGATGLLGLVANRTIDLVYDATFAITHTRLEHFDVTLPLQSSHLVVLSSAQAAAVGDVSKVFRVFSTDVWLLLAAVRQRRPALCACP